MTDGSPRQEPDTAVDSPERDDVAPVRRRGPLRLAIQIVGYLASLALMGYCVAVAVAGDAPARLAEATTAQLVGLLACSLVSVITHGATWWILFRPIKRLPFLGVQSINAIASLLFYAPLKLSVVARVALHRRVDRLRYAHIAAWFVAVTGCLGAAASGLLAVSALRGFAMPVRIAAGALVLGLIVTAIVVVARLHLVERLFRGSEQMLAYPLITGMAVLLRLIDLGAQAIRLRISSEILDQSIDLGEAFALTVMSLAGAVVSPFGALGIREWLTGALARLLGTSEDQALLQSAGTVSTASEALVVLVLAIVGLLWLRPHRLFGRGKRYDTV
jgi:hypothetical protein